MKHPILTRSVSLLLALLFVLATPGYALEQAALTDEAAVGSTDDGENVDSSDPFSNAGDDQDDSDAEEAGQSEAAQPETVQPETAQPESVQPETVQPESVQPETEQPEEKAPVYVDEDGSYLAPEEITVFINSYLDEGKEADSSEAVKDYTGIVAFYDYNQTDREKRLDEPYFFYYKEGKLQDEDPVFASADRFLALTAPDGETEQAYQAEESYVDEDASVHPEYLFAFNQEGKDNGLYTGVYEEDGKTYEEGLTSVAQPVDETDTTETEEEPEQIPAVEITALTQVKDTGLNPTLTWAAAENAVSYEIHRSVNGGAWAELAAVAGDKTSYTDTTASAAGSEYAYYIIAVFDGDIKSAVPEQTQIVTYVCHSVPKVTVKAVAGGPQVSWTADNAAIGYRVYRNYQQVADLTQGDVSSWVDQSAPSNGTYNYTVRAYYGEKDDMAAAQDYTSNVWSGYAVSGKVYYLAAPEITNTYGDSSGMKLTWSKVAGAATYRIYRAAAGSSTAKWTLLGEVASSVTSFVDAKAQVGVHYIYTVRAFNSSKVGGVYYDFRGDNTKSIAIHTAPTVKTGNGVGGVKVAWSKDADATGYRIFRKGGSSKGYQVIADITKGTTVSYVDKTAVSGQTYVYTVRAYYGSDIAKDKNYNTTSWSPYKAAAALLYLATPELGNVYSSSNGMYVSWKPVSGATAYLIFRKTAETNWKGLATVQGATVSSYVDKTAAANGAYYYTVRAIYKDKTHISGYNTPTTGFVYHAPVQVAVASVSNGTRVTWKLDAKATGYRIFRKTGKSLVALTNVSASAFKAGTTTGSYVDTSSNTSGTTCYYTVRAYYGTGDIKSVGVDTKNNWGGFIYQKYISLATPGLAAVAHNTASGIKVAWTKVDGAAGYVVYRRTGTSTKWSKVTTVTGGNTVAYVDTSSTKLAAGTVCYYTVRALGSDKTSMSYYNKTGTYSVYLPAPELISSIVQAKGTTVTWGAVNGASGYMVYRRTTSSGWKLVTTTTSAKITSYVDTSVTNEKVAYLYTVKAYRTDTVNNKKATILGAYESNGISFALTAASKGITGTGWENKDGSTYYVKNGVLLTGWQYLDRNGGHYKYYFDTKTGALVTNLYSYFGKSYRNLKCRIEVCINRDNSNPSRVTIYIYDNDTKEYCIPAVSVRCIGSHGSTCYSSGNTSKSAYVSRRIAAQRWLDSGSYEQYAVRVAGTYSWFHSCLYYGSKSPYKFASSTYNSMVDNNNNSGGCIRLQCIYAYLILDITRNGYGQSHNVPVVLYHNYSLKGPFGKPKVDKISSRSSDPTDPAVTGKFFYDTSVVGVSAKSGAKTWVSY